ncbi:hypothetical protein AB0I81_30235 [Nonomuraea sp. NPDC050404]|uniref:hypothetical protein n=1 Tax=Nonomuraea sp. NPDC050404 TaxID=3155783 RepID=UPI0033DE066F
MSYGYGNDCSAAQNAQRAADDVRHEVGTLSSTVDSNRWEAENRADALERRIRELEQRVIELEN